MSVGVTTTGLAELHRAIDQLPAAVETALQAVARQSAERIAARARQLVPVRTGRTQRSIRVREDLSHHAYHVDVGAHKTMPAEADWPANLPLWIEFGTRFVPARPFMRPAADAERDPYRRALETASAQVLEKVFR